MTISEAKLAKSTASRFRAIAWVVLLAFTTQSFITQTHIHGVFGGSGSPAAAKTLASGSPHSNIPAPDSTSDCPFCQAITHAGAFSAPPAPCLILPVSLAEAAAPILVAAIFSILSPHPWHSRAPPQH